MDIELGSEAARFGAQMVEALYGGTVKSYRPIISIHNPSAGTTTAIGATSDPRFVYFGSIAGSLKMNDNVSQCKVGIRKHDGTDETVNRAVGTYVTGYAGPDRLPLVFESTLAHYVGANAVASNDVNLTFVGYEYRLE